MQLFKLKFEPFLIHIVVIMFQHCINGPNKIASGVKSDKKIADKLMYIPYNDTQNYLLCRL